MQSAQANLYTVHKTLPTSLYTEHANLRGYQTRNKTIDNALLHICLRSQQFACLPRICTAGENASCVKILTTLWPAPVNQDLQGNDQYSHAPPAEIQSRLDVRSV